MTELFWQDIFRRIKYLLEKNKDQFIITHVDEEAMTIDAQIRIMFDIFGKREDIVDYTLALEPNFRKSELENGIANISFIFPIPSHIEAACAFLIYIAPISTYFDRELTIHNFDNCIATYSMTQDITHCKYNGYVWMPTYTIHLSIDYDRIDEFFDILSNYYKYMDEIKEKITTNINKFLKDREDYKTLKQGNVNR